MRLAMVIGLLIGASMFIWHLTENRWEASILWLIWMELALIQSDLTERSING